MNHTVVRSSDVIFTNISERLLLLRWSLWDSTFYEEVGGSFNGEEFTTSNSTRPTQSIF